MRSPEHEVVVRTLKELSGNYRAVRDAELKVEGAARHFFAGCRNGESLAIRTLARNWRTRNKKGVESER